MHLNNLSYVSEEVKAVSEAPVTSAAEMLVKAASEAPVTSAAEMLVKAAASTAPSATEVKLFENKEEGEVSRFVWFIEFIS